MQVTLTAKTSGFATVTTNEAVPRTINFTPRKSGWYTYDMNSKVLGAQFEIPDAAIITANTGRTVVDQMTAPVAIEAWGMQTAFTKMNVADKQNKAAEAALSAGGL